MGEIDFDEIDFLKEKVDSIIENNEYECLDCFTEQQVWEIIKIGFYGCEDVLYKHALWEERWKLDIKNVCEELGVDMKDLTLEDDNIPEGYIKFFIVYSNADDYFEDDDDYCSNGFEYDDNKWINGKCSDIEKKTIVWQNLISFGFDQWIDWVMENFESESDERIQFFLEWTEIYLLKHSNLKELSGGKRLREVFWEKFFSPQSKPTLIDNQLKELSGGCEND